jgi:ubiquinone/menaquinone biosynthesis C-methylase UbiE
MNQTQEPDKRRGEHLFNRIAPIYGWFYAWQKRRFSALLDKAPAEIGLALHGSVLDVGCGTGALCAALHEKGLQVCGVDPAARMLEVARKKSGNAPIRFVEGNALQRLPFEDKQFDLSFASYVAHGMKPESRSRMYAEMARVTRNKVIIHDYNNRRKPLTSFVEWLERGDYFHFIHHAEPEMRQCLEGLRKCFSAVEVIQVGEQAAWYVCTPNEKKEVSGT